METINIIRHDPIELKEDEHGLLICLEAAFGKKWVCEATYNHDRRVFNNGAIGSYPVDQVLWFIRKSELIEACPIIIAELDQLSETEMKYLKNLIND